MNGVYTTRKKNYCAQCFTNAVIKCAWCERPIAPGRPITLYTPTEANFQIPEGAIIYSEIPVLQLVGCLRTDCAESGLDRSGFWEMPGKVRRVASPLEMCVASNDVVIVNDLADPAEAINIEELDNL